MSQPVRCAHDICTKTAVTRLPLKTGWANLCLVHYERHIQEGADEFCRDNGLVTVEQKIAYCKAKIGGIGKGIQIPALDRQPGQDDEERAA